MSVANKSKRFFDIFPVPSFLMLSTVGIAITGKDIKLAQLRRGLSGGKLRVAHLSILDSSNPTASLKELSSRYGIHFVKATLPEEKSYLFTADIDKVPREGLYDAVAFIIEENVPLTLPEAVFDFEIIGEDKSEGKIKIAVTVFPKKVVEAEARLFESAGMTPVSFDVESQAIARAIIPRGDRRAQLIINLSDEKTGFYVVEKEIVQFSTTVSHGVGGDDLEQSLESLKAEVIKIPDFWEDRTKESENISSKIEYALICGHGANNTDFIRKFMGGSDIPFAIADAWINLPFKERHVSEMPFDEYLDYACAIGLVVSNKTKNYV